MVSAVSDPDQGLAQRHGIQAQFFLVQVTTALLARIGTMLTESALRTQVGAILPLADAAIAHEMLDGHRAHPRGKIVLRVA